MYTLYTIFVLSITIKDSTMIFTASSLTFSIDLTDGTYRITRLDTGKIYKRTFTTLEKAQSFCIRITRLSHLAKEARRIAKHFSKAVTKWCFDQARKHPATLAEQVSFYTKLGRFTMD